MLVYAKNPHGVVHLPDGKTVYGAQTGRSPTDIDFELYKNSEGTFVDATYRSYDLQKMFERPFSPIAFKPSEIRYLPYPSLRKLGAELGVSTGTGAKRHALSKIVRYAITRGPRRCVLCNKTFAPRNDKQEKCRTFCRGKRNES